MSAKEGGGCIVYGICIMKIMFSTDHTPVATR